MGLTPSSSEIHTVSHLQFSPEALISILNPSQTAVRLQQGFNASASAPVSNERTVDSYSARGELVALSGRHLLPSNLFLHPLQPILNPHLLLCSFGFLGGLGKRSCLSKHAPYLHSWAQKRRVVENAQAATTESE